MTTLHIMNPVRRGKVGAKMAGNGVIGREVFGITDPMNQISTCTCS